jgi:hypothetical protein
MYFHDMRKDHRTWLSHDTCIQGHGEIPLKIPPKYNRLFTRCGKCLPHSDDVSIDMANVSLYMTHVSQDMVRGSKDMITVHIYRINVYIDTANASPDIVNVSLDMIL